MEMYERDHHNKHRALGGGVVVVEIINNGGDIGKNIDNGARDLVSATSFGVQRRRKRMARYHRRPSISFVTFRSSSSSPDTSSMTSPSAAPIAVIQAKKIGEEGEEDVYTEISKNAISDIHIEDYPEVNNIESFDTFYPSMENNVGMSFVYETTFNYSPLDFLGGCMTNYARISPSENSPSVENFYSDDFS